MESILTNISSTQSLIVVIGFHLIFQMGKFLFSMLKKDKSASDETVNKLTVEVEKLRKDLQRFYSAIKMIAGDNWEKVSEKIQKDENFLK